MNIEAETPIRSVAATYPAARAVFEAMGIDYACAGEQTLAEAAYAQGVEPALLLGNLRGLEPAKRDSWEDRPLVDLIHHLIAEHHRLVRDEVARISMQLAELCTASVTNADMRELRAAAVRLAEIIIPHVHEEEEVLFPEIEALERAWQSAGPPPRHTAEMHDAVKKTLADHALISAQLSLIRDLRLRAGAAAVSAPCRETLELMQRIEGHLHEYMFLENCVLVPRAMAMATAEQGA